jgi:hypothetical protein
MGSVQENKGRYETTVEGAKLDNSRWPVGTRIVTAFVD